MKSKISIYPKGSIKALPWKSIFLQNYDSIFRSIPSATKVSLNCIERFHDFERNHGLSITIKIFKECERHVRMTFLGHPSIFKPVFWLETDRHELPLFLKISHGPKDEAEYQRAVLTALGYYRLYSLSPDESVINRITEPASQTLDASLLNEIESFSQSFFEERGITQFTKSDSFPIYATTKAGASGPSAMGETSIVDAQSIVDTSIFDKIQNILPKVYSETAVKQFQKIFEESLKQFKPTPEYKPALSRIHLLCEGGGKTRAVCIPDIWTQSALKPIHEYLMNVLKFMPNDGTFSHPALAEKVKRFTTRHSLFCYDLTAATDRFPLEFQKRVLKPLLGDLVEGWSTLITERDFRYKKQLIRYGVGQPMGMLSSWAAFSISHHILINFCKKDKSFYAVIGDDMVMQSRRAAEKYRALLDHMGVQISDEKSLEPTHDSRTAEIAKRYFRNGIDISPIPPLVLVESTKSVEGFIEFIEVLASRISKSGGSIGLDWSEPLSRLWNTNRDRDSEPAQALLQSPTYLEDFKGFQTRVPPLSGVPERWDCSKDRFIMNLWDRFILDEVTTKLNQSKVVLRSLGIDSSRPSSTEIGQTPIIRSYLTCKQVELDKVIRIYGGTYVGGEADSFEPTPQNVLKKLLSEPDPYSPKDFQEKRIIRRKRSLQLIQKFWIKNKRMISPPVPKTD
jgi:hypothetical protein